MKKSGRFLQISQKRNGRAAFLIAFASVACLLAVLGLYGMETATVEADNHFSVSDEKKLVLYTSHKKEVYGPLVQEFEERTGVWVEIKTGGTIELMEQLAVEAGESSCDVMFGGGVESYEAFKEYFEPYLCSGREHLSPGFYSTEGKWIGFSRLPIVFIYHNKLVEEAEAPKTWEALFDETWKGRLAFADPLSSGTSCTALLTMCQVKKLAPKELVKDFYDVLDGEILPDSQRVIDEVTQGTKLVGITLEESALKARKRGADIGIIYPGDGVSAVPDGAAIVKNAPHSENARLFLDFVVSREVQEFLGDSLCRRSVRTDIGSKEGFPEMDTMDFDLEWAGAHQKELLGWWKDLTGQGGPL